MAKNKEKAGAGRTIVILLVVLLLLLTAGAYGFPGSESVSVPEPGAI